MRGCTTSWSRALCSRFGDQRANDSTNEDRAPFPRLLNRRERLFWCTTHSLSLVDDSLLLLATLTPRQPSAGIPSFFKTRLILPFALAHRYRTRLDQLLPSDRLASDPSDSFARSSMATAAPTLSVAGHSVSCTPPSLGQRDAEDDVLADSHQQNNHENNHKTPVCDRDMAALQQATLCASPSAASKGNRNPHDTRVSARDDTAEGAMTREETDAVHYWHDSELKRHFMVRAMPSPESALPASRFP